MSIGFGKGDRRGVPDGRPNGAVANSRLGLLVFGFTLLVLFAVLAIAEGIGDPKIPAEAVAVVEDVPGEAGTISELEFDRAVEDLEEEYGGEEVEDLPGAQYTGAREWALINLIESAWLVGEAAERGITVSEEEVDEQLEQYENESFESSTQFREFLKSQDLTLDLLEQQARQGLLQGALQEQIQNEAPTVSRSAIESFYESRKDSLFTEQPSRDVRRIVNKDRSKIMEALGALSEDSTAENWNRVAEQYSDEPALSQEGGLVEDVVEGALEEPLGAAVYAASVGRVEGPLTSERGSYIFEVTKITPAKVQPLESVEDQIKEEVEPEVEREYSDTLQSNYYASWVPRTFCAPGHVLTYCANYENDPHPSTADPACYEVDPKKGRPEDCPAPVAQVVPALPGSMRPFVPKGTPLPQRPHPAGRNSVESLLPGT